MLAAMKVAVLCVVALAGAVKAGSGSGSGSSGSGSGSELEAADATTLAPTTLAPTTLAPTTTAGFDTTAPFTTATMKADYTHPPDNATTAPSDIATAGFDTTAPPPANATTTAAAVADADTTTAAAAAATTAAPAADADTTAAAVATQAPAASAGTTVALKEIAVKENRQSAKFVVSMEKEECDTLQKSPEDVKKTTEAVAAAAKVDASKLDFGASKSKCVAPGAGRRQRRAAVNLEVTLVFKKDVSAADVATTVAAANALIKAGGFEVTVIIGGVPKTIAVTQTVTQATEVVTVMVPNPDYVPVNGTTATAQPGTTTNAVVNTPKASASLARGSALLVAALAASHALLA